MENYGKMPDEILTIGLPECEDVADVVAWLKAQVGVQKLSAAFSHHIHLLCDSRSKIFFEEAVCSLFPKINLEFKNIPGGISVAIRKEVRRLTSSFDESPRQERETALPNFPMNRMVIEELVKIQSRFNKIVNDVDEYDWARRLQCSRNHSGVQNNKGACGEVFLDAIAREVILRLGKKEADIEFYSPVFSSDQQRREMEMCMNGLLKPEFRCYFEDNGCFIKKNKKGRWRVAAEYENVIAGVGANVSAFVLLDITTGRGDGKTAKALRFKHVMVRSEAHEQISVLNIRLGGRSNFQRGQTVYFSALHPLQKLMSQSRGKMNRDDNAKSSS